MIDKSADRLEYLCVHVPPLLDKIEEQTFSFKPSNGKWSKKEILGHLIDSATNNHHRFVRGQFEESPEIWYNQDKWNEFGYHQQMPQVQLIDFWTVYNKHLATLIRFIPKERLLRTCKMKDGNLKTLDFLINDYIEHLEHHLHQIIQYDF